MRFNRLSSGLIKMIVYKVAYILKQAIRIPLKSFSVRLILCIDTYTKSKYQSSVDSESLKAFQSKGRKNNNTGSDHQGQKTTKMQTQKSSILPAT